MRKWERAGECKRKLESILNGGSAKEISLCVCVCVRKKEKEERRERETKIKTVRNCMSMSSGVSLR